METSTSKIVVESRDGVGWITLNNVERRNAISLDMWQAMGEAFEGFSADGAVRCVVMTGAGGKAFASGADISQFEKLRANADAAREYGKRSMAARQVMMAFDKPVIAMIQGFCLGGGLGLAMTADLRVASEDSSFGIPAARLGIAYDFTYLSRLVHLVGPARANEILMTARRLPADEALAIGLVNRVVPAEGLASAVQDVTDRMVENAPLSMRASKFTIAQVLRDPAERDMDTVREMERACFDSADYAEGRAAFMAKRKPAFSGR